MDVRFPGVNLHVSKGVEMAVPVRYSFILLNEDEFYFFNRATYFRLYENLSAVFLKSEGGRR